MKSYHLFNEHLYMFRIKVEGWLLNRVGCVQDFVQERKTNFD